MDSLLAGGLGYMLGSQMQKANQQQTPPQYQQPAPQGNPADARLAQLQQLGQLHASGVLNDEEFEREKQKILNGF